MRSLTLGIMAGLGIAAGSLPALAQSTTRIEPRPFYGATVTMEAGLLAMQGDITRVIGRARGRVWRPERRAPCPA